MTDRFTRELQNQIAEIRDALRTREFWVYFALLSALIGLLIALAYVAAGFDELTRQQALLAIACRAGDMQLLTIIVGGMCFVLLSVFALGEVVAWFENQKRAQTNRWRTRDSKWRPAVFVAAALGLGAAGFMVLQSWCR